MEAGRRPARSKVKGGAGHPALCLEKASSEGIRVGQKLQDLGTFRVSSQCPSRVGPHSPAGLGWWRLAPEAGGVDGPVKPSPTSWCHDAR